MIPFESLFSYEMTVSGGDLGDRPSLALIREGREAVREELVELAGHRALVQHASPLHRGTSLIRNCLPLGHIHRYLSHTKVPPPETHTGVSLS